MLTLILASGAAPTHAQDCPAENQFARSLVMTFLFSDLTESQFSDNRQETGTTSIDTSNVQRVQDSSTCKTLNEKYGKLDVDLRDVVYYRTDDRYFISIPFDKTDNGTTALGVEFLIALDVSLNEIKKYRI